MPSKIQDLTQRTNPKADDELVFVQGGVTVKMTLSDLMTQLQDAVPFCNAYQNVAQSIPNSSWENVTFHGVYNDTDSFWAAGSPTRFTFSVAGKYFITYRTIWADVNYRYRRLAVNAYPANTTIITASCIANTGGAGVWGNRFSGSTIYDFDVNDYIEPLVYSHTGSIAVNLNLSYIGIVRIG